MAAKKIIDRPLGATVKRHRTAPYAGGNDIGLWLKELRIEKGLLLREVAAKLGLTSYQFIYNLENGLCLPPLNHITVLAKLYDVPEREIRIRIVKQCYTNIKRKYGFK